MKKSYLSLIIGLLLVVGIASAGYITIPRVDARMMLPAVAGSPAADPGGSCDTSVDSETGATVDSVDSGRYSSHYYIANKFEASESYTLCSVTVRLSKAGSPEMNVTAYIYTDNTDDPGSEVTGTESDAISASTFPETEGDVTFENMSYSLTNGETYWIVLSNSATEGSNYYVWHYSDPGTVEHIKREGTPISPPWTTATSAYAGKYTTYK